MMNRVKKGYVLDPKYEEETKLSCYSPGAVKLGFTDPHDGAQKRNFLNHQGPDGKPLLRKQKNAPKWCYQVVFSCHPTIDALFKGASRQEKKRIQEAALRAGLTAVRWLEKHIGVGRGAGGKRLEPAELLARLDLHDRTRNNDCSVHVHATLLRAARAADGKTYAIRDRRVLYTHAKKAQEMFHLALTVELLSLGYAATFQKGKAVIPGVDYAAAMKTRSRRQESLERLKAAGYPSPTPRQVRMDLIIHRPKKTAYDEEKLHSRWRAEADRDTPGVAEKARRAFSEAAVKVRDWLKGVLESNLTLPWQVIGTAVKKAWELKAADPQTVVIRNASAFLFDTSKRPRCEGHRAALRAVRWGTFSSLNEALKAAERAYKAARKPRLLLEKGAVVLVPKEVAVTAEQVGKILARADKVKATVQFQGEEARAHAQRYRQEQEQKKTQRNDQTKGYKASY